MKKRHTPTGFTLVEIIVVLVVLAILAAFTIPAMLGFVEDARSKAAIAEAREVYVAAQAAATELYPEYSAYDDGIRHQKTGDKDCSIKKDLFTHMQSKLAGDIKLDHYVYSGEITTDNSLEVGVDYTFNTEANLKIWSTASSIYSECAKVWFNAKKGDNAYNRTAAAFKVQSIWYVTKDKKYLVVIQEDVSRGGPSTTVTKIK